MAQRDCDHCGREWNIDEECPAPGGMLNQPAAENRSHCCCDRSEAGPGTDRLAASFFVERCANDREAAGHEKSSSYTLDTSCDHELLNVRGKTASDRSPRENSYANQEHRPAAKQVAEGAANENQSSQEQPVRLDHPLHADDSCVETCLECGESNIDDGAVDESHAGTEDRRGKYPESRFFSTRNSGTYRPDYGFVARWSHGCYR